MKPLIGVTGPVNGGLAAWLFTALGVRLAGGEATRLTAEQHKIDRPLQGIIIGGGSDIDPSLYDETAAEEAKLDPARDAFELTMIEAALKNNMPILGICRGCQLLNIAHGGNLHQSIKPMLNGDKLNYTPLPSKDAYLNEHSKLHGMVGHLSLRINSLHNQAVKEPGEGFDVVAKDRWGITQAIENPNAAYRIGVQWHPEYLPYFEPQRRLFQALVAAAKHYRIPS